MFRNRDIDGTYPLLLSRLEASQVGVVVLAPVVPLRSTPCKPLTRSGALLRCDEPTYREQRQPHMLLWRLFQKISQWGNPQTNRHRHAHVHPNVDNHQNNSSRNIVAILANDKPVKPVRTPDRPPLFTPTKNFRISPGRPAWALSLARGRLCLPRPLHRQGTHSSGANESKSAGNGGEWTFGVWKCRNEETPRPILLCLTFSFGPFFSLTPA